jgi:hypothetical protein
MKQFATMALLVAIASGCSGKTEGDSGEMEQETAKAEKKAEAAWSVLSARGAKTALQVTGNVESVNGKVTVDTRQYRLVIDLSGTAMTDEDLKHVVDYHDVLQTGLLQDTSAEWHPGSAESVGVLKLDNTSISDAGVSQLNKLTDLQELSVSGTKITQEGVKKLQDSLGKQRTEIVTVDAD